MTGVDVRACLRCGRPELDGYPHRHELPLRADIDPMPARPSRLYCGPLDVTAYWSGGPWEPTCCLVHVAAAEYRAEIPESLHPSRGRVPARTEPIPLEPKRLDGPMLDVLDVGALGGYPFAPAAARRLGGVTMLDGAQTLNAADYRAFPWAYVLAARLPGHCRRRHPEHRTDHPLCAELVRLVVVAGYPPPVAGVRLAIEAPLVAPLLEDALRWTWRRVSEELNDISLGRKKTGNSTL